MEFDYKIISLIIWIILTFIWYYHYIKDIFKWKTKPHIFSHVIWWLLISIAFVAQLSDNAWPWAWVTWVTAIVSIFVAIISIKKWEKNITKTDKYSFLGAILTIVIWYITDNALYSVLLITLIDALWFYPTFRKSYYKPFQETLSTYLLSWIKFIFWIIALTNFTLITYTYPLSLVIMDLSFVLMLTIRRKQIWKQQEMSEKVYKRKK